RVLWALKAQHPVELRDPVLYLILSDHIAAGDGYRYGFETDQGVTAYYPPGYPLALGAVLAVVRLLPGDASAFDVAVWFNVVLSVATIGLVFVLGRRLADVRVGLVAAAIWALWPNLVLHSAVVLTETLFLFLLVLMLVVLLGNPESARLPGRARLITVGVLFGVTLLVRPVSAVIAPVFLVLWWGAGAKAALWRLALVGVATVAVLVPWSIRSTLAMDEPVAMSLNFGDNLCLGHNPGASGGFGDLGAYCYTAEELSRPESETRRQSENIERAVDYIVDNPGEILRRTPSKLRITLQNDHDGLQVAEDFGEAPLLSDGGRDLVKAVANGFYYLVAVAAIAGGVVLLRRPDPARRGLFLVVAGAAQLIAPLATFGDARFKMPIYPTLAICAAVALVALWDRRSTPTLATPVEGDGDTARADVASPV
ncbi:MAG: glycosyltransferase family 39 protein, partial [Acidimicrobiales bacterium]|nr:glycosyltransferase family 39 protein [Acidimicrobiales bacterium]